MFGAGKGLVGTVLFFAIWFSYFNVSKRIKATLPGDLGSPDALLLDAARNGDFGRVKALLKDNPDSLFRKDNIGVTALHSAAEKGRKDVAELLLADKAEVNAKNKYGSTPLHWAAFGGHKDVAELLLATGPMSTPRATTAGRLCTMQRLGERRRWRN